MRNLKYANYLGSFDEFQQIQPLVKENPSIAQQLAAEAQKRKVKSTLVEFVPESNKNSPKNTTRWNYDEHVLRNNHASTKSIDELLKSTIKPTSKLKLFDMGTEEIQHVIPEPKIINDGKKTVSSPQKQATTIAPDSPIVHTKNTDKKLTSSDMILQLRTEGILLLSATNNSVNKKGLDLIELRGKQLKMAAQYQQDRDAWEETKKQKDKLIQRQQEHIAEKDALIQQLQHDLQQTKEALQEEERQNSDARLERDELQHQLHM